MNSVVESAPGRLGLLSRAALQQLLQQLDFARPDWPQDLAQTGLPLWSEAASGQPGMAQVDFFFDAASLAPAATALATVYIEVHSHTAHPLNASVAMQQIAQTSVWYWRTELPIDWCGSYQFIPVSATQVRPADAEPGVLRAWWQALLASVACADPLSPYPAYRSGWGRQLAQLFGPAAYLPTGLPTNLPAISPAAVAQQVWHSQRMQSTYRWSGWTTPDAAAQAFAAAPVCLVLHLDGQNWRDLPGFIAGLQHLHQQQQLVSTLHVFLENGGLQQRYRDYGCNADFIQALTEELLPVLKRQFHSEFSFGVLICGQSLGGLAALYAHLLAPRVFHCCVSLSGSYWWPDSDLPETERQLVAGLRRGQFKLPVTRTTALQQRALWLAAGDLETDMRADSIAMHQALALAAYPCTYRDFRGGHDLVCWCQALYTALSQLLKPALLAASH